MQKDLLFEQGKEILKTYPLTLEEVATELSLREGDALNLLEELGAKRKGLYFYLGKKPPSPIPEEAGIQAIIKQKTSHYKIKQLEKENKSLKEEVHKLYQSRYIEENLSEWPESPVSLISQSNTKSRQQTAVLVLSDWHIGERVLPETVNYVNEFNFEVAKKRLQRLFSKVYSHLLELKKTRNLQELVVWLGGDLIGGYIHEELMENNCLSPQEEVDNARAILIEAIEGLRSLEIPIQVVCNWGNHGRTTKDKKFATAAVNNNEWLLYSTLEDMFSRLNYNDVKWHVSKSYYSFIDLYDYRIRFHHGDGMKVNPSSNMNNVVQKKIKALNQIVPADFDIFGHFHSLRLSKNFLCNGSLIGANGFSHNLGFPPEPPKQVLFMVDSHYGFDSDFITLRAD